MCNLCVVTTLLRVDSAAVTTQTEEGGKRKEGMEMLIVAKISSAKSKNSGEQKHTCTDNGVRSVQRLMEMASHEGGIL